METITQLKECAEQEIWKTLEHLKKLNVCYGIDEIGCAIEHLQIARNGLLIDLEDLQDKKEAD